MLFRSLASEPVSSQTNTMPLASEPVSSQTNTMPLASEPVSSECVNVYLNDP